MGPCPSQSKDCDEWSESLLRPLISCPEFQMQCPEPTQYPSSHGPAQSVPAPAEDEQRWPQSLTELGWKQARPVKLHPAGPWTTLNVTVFIWEGAQQCLPCRVVMRSGGRLSTVLKVQATQRAFMFHERCPSPYHHLYLELPLHTSSSPTGQRCDTTLQNSHGVFGVHFPREGCLSALCEQFPPSSP